MRFQRREAIRRVTILVSASVLGLIACQDAERARESERLARASRQETSTNPDPEYSRPYAFTDDWFSSRIATWRRILAPMAGKPDLHYLEVGVYEGRSFFWMLDQILTHPTSRLTGIDIFMYPRFLENIELSGQGHRVTTIEGSSRVELRKLPLESFDIIYVDGSHTADDVLSDAVLGWGLLKTGSIIVFDDRHWDGSYFTGQDSLPAVLLPGMAIEAFLQAYRNTIEVVHSGYQLVLRKRENPCVKESISNKSFCSPVDQYTYNWKEKKLLRGPDHTPVDLSESERRLLEEILRARRLEGKAFVLPEPFGSDAAVRTLIGRLGLDVRFRTNARQHR